MANSGGRLVYIGTHALSRQRCGRANGSLHQGVTHEGRAAVTVTTRQRRGLAGRVRLSEAARLRLQLLDASRTRARHSGLARGLI